MDRCLSILIKYAKEDFRNTRITEDGFIELQDQIISILKKERAAKLQDKKIRLETRIQYLELFNFDTFMSIRLGYYALILGIIAILLNKYPIELMGITLDHFISCSIWFLIFVLLSLIYVSRKQKEELIYLTFVLRCLNAIIDYSKSNKRIG